MKDKGNFLGLTVVGIDVGGLKKGFHAIAIQNGRYHSRKQTDDIADLVKWCRETVKAKVIGIDAPCLWSSDGRARPAERQLMKMGIWCFSTPSIGVAHRHPKNHFGWMLQGAALFGALSSTHPLCLQLPPPDGVFCFETYPHAITWHLRGGNAKAKSKRPQRSRLLKEAGIDLGKPSGIDWVDAALCGVTALSVATQGRCVCFGDGASGLIIVPTELQNKSG